MFEFNSKDEEVTIWASISREIYIKSLRCSGDEYYAILDNGASLLFEKRKSVTALTLLNFDYAAVEPNLFRFFLIEDKILHIVCYPIYKSHGGNISRYLWDCMGK